MSRFRWLATRALPLGPIHIHAGPGSCWGKRGPGYGLSLALYVGSSFQPLFYRSGWLGIGATAPFMKWPLHPMRDFLLPDWDRRHLPERHPEMRSVRGRWSSKNAARALRPGRLGRVWHRHIESYVSLFFQIANAARTHNGFDWLLPLRAKDRCIGRFLC